MHTVAKEEMELSLFVDDIIAQEENSKDLQKLLKLVSEFDKIAGYKINIQKSIIFLYTSKKHMETKIKIQHHLQSLFKKNTRKSKKNIQYWYVNNYIISMKAISKIKQMERQLCSQIERHNKDE